MTTPSKPDLVALADELDSAIENHLYASASNKETCANLLREVLWDNKVGISKALRHLASQPSLYEAGLRDAVVGLNAALDRYWEGIRTDAQMTKICDWQGKCQAAIAALPADGGEDDDERCIACDRPFQDGDLVHSDAGGGCIHASCCGPERESYVNADGDPLKDGEPIPEPWAWTKDIQSSDGGAEDGSSPIPANREEMRARAHGVMPVGDSADASGCTDVGPSEATPSTAGSVREALAWCISEIELEFMRNKKAYPADPEKKKRFEEAKALALSAPVEAPVAVKALEWIDTGQRGRLQKHYYAVAGSLRHTVHPVDSEDGGFFEHYGISENPSEPLPWKLVYWVGNNGLSGVYEYFATLDQAKAAAQADYEQRIRSALIATPRPLPSRDQITRLIRENCQAISDDDRVCSEIDGIDEAVTAILTLLGGSAHGR